jgi:hypothetical protein
MIVLISSSNLDFDFTFDQSENEIADGLIECVKSKYGADYLSRASQVIVVESNFYHIIKNRHGHRLIGEHIDSLQDKIDEYLLV